MAQVVGQAKVVARMVAALPSLPDSALAAPLTYISALITAVPAKQFAAQFVEAGGASPANLHRCPALHAAINHAYLPLH